MEREAMQKGLTNHFGVQKYYIGIESFLETREASNLLPELMAAKTEAAKAAANSITAR